MSLAAGTRLGSYEILALIGAGGMGEVYRARDAKLNRFVAIKVLSANAADSDPARRFRFIQEARAASGLNHPNIITIHDIVSEGDTEFMVMEYLEGRSLDALIPQSGLPVRQVLDYGMQIASALSAAHDAGIVHRDLKPANVMVTDRGLLKVLDFGLAKLTGMPGEMDGDTQSVVTHRQLTVEGSIMGTLSYMSPEQALGKKIDARSDIFSFGVLLYEMVAGCRAFAGASGIATILAVARDEPRPLGDVAPGVPPQLEQIVNGCLRKEPEERWQSMKDVYWALATLKSQLDSSMASAAGAAGVAAVPAGRGSRWKWVAAAVAALILVLAAAVAGVWRMGHRAPAPVAARSTSSAPAALTNDSVIAMARAHVPVALILEQIRASRTNFDLSTGEIIRLTQAGLPEGVIEQMRNPRRVVTGAPAPVPPVQTVSVRVTDGTPFRIRLEEDVPVDAEEGRALRFTAVGEIRWSGGVIVARGARVMGVITQSGKRSRFGFGGGKVSFGLTGADAVDGQKVNVRVLPKGKTGVVQRPLNVGKTGSKNVAAVAGTGYVAFVDGDQTVTVRR
jgi:serine/threonine-protein kinase